VVMYLVTLQIFHRMGRW